MKTAISIPDDLFADAEELARELKKSRSRLYGDAVREYVARHSAESITESLDRVCDAVECCNDFAGAAARRTFERSDW
jgi:metal-responsive CopG/Arc/MetJ family transcriptional regulator